MTDEQINIAIAESLGWKVRWQNQGGAPTLENKPAGHCWAVWTNPNGWGLDSNYDPIFPPNYTADLNAMHEAMLLHPRKLLLRNFLYLEVLEDPTNTNNEPAWATAKQWAIAYVKSLGKWDA